MSSRPPPTPTYLAPIEAGRPVRAWLPVLCAALIAAAALAVLAGTASGRLVTLPGTATVTGGGNAGAILHAPEAALPCLAPGNVLVVGRDGDRTSMRISHVAVGPTGSHVVYAMAVAPSIHLNGPVEARLHVSRGLVDLLLPARWRKGSPHYRCEDA